MNRDSTLYAVKYYAGPYNGVHRLFAESGQEAIEETRRWVRKLMTLPMYADGYTLVDPDTDEPENE